MECGFVTVDKTKVSKLLVDQIKDSTDNKGRNPTAGNNVHIQWRGDVLVMKFRFHNFVSARGTGRGFKARH